MVNVISSSSLGDFTLIVWKLLEDGISNFVMCVNRVTQCWHHAGLMMDLIPTTSPPFASPSPSSYIISVGLVDKLAWYFNGVHGPIDADQPAGEFLQHAMAMLSSMIKIASQR